MTTYAEDEHAKCFKQKRQQEQENRQLRSELSDRLNEAKDVAERCLERFDRHRRKEDEK
jgi:hypothetical protein